MPTVPTYGDRRVREAPLPQVQPGPAAPAEAFGGGPGAARVISAGMGLAETALKIQEEEKRKADQLLVLDADSRLSSLETSLQYDPKTGAMTRRGKDALALPDEVKTSWDKGVEGIARGLKNDAQRMAFRERVSSRWASVNNNIQRHVADQISAYDNDTTKSFLENERNAAALNYLDDQRVALAKSRQAAAIQEHARRNGLPPEMVQARAAEAVSGTNVVVIERMVDNGDYQRAKEYFEANKDQFTAQDAVMAERRVRAGVLQDRKLRTWEGLAGPEYKRADGTYDDSKLRDAVFSKEDLSSDEKDAVFDYVRARAANADTDLHQDRQAIDREFMNNLVTAKKQGATLDEAMRLADRYGFDPVDAAAKADAVHKFYARPEQTDPNTYMALWEGVQGGTADRESIDRAFQQGKVSVSDWEGLRKDFWQSKVQGNDPDSKDMWGRIKLLAETKFGNNKGDREQFLYTVQNAVRGKPPAEMWKTANDMLKDVDVSYSWFDKPAYQAQQKQIDAQNLAWGQLYQDMGRPTIQAIGQGLLLSGRDSWSIRDVTSFADAFGGPAALKPGQPAGNAIQSLIRRGQPVTQRNIQAILAVHKDGNY